MASVSPPPPQASSRLAFGQSIRQCPFHDAVKVPALVPGAEVGRRGVPVAEPVEGDCADVAVAHDLLAKHIDAMVYVMLRQAGCGRRLRLNHFTDVNSELFRRVAKGKCTCGIVLWIGILADQVLKFVSMLLGHWKELAMRKRVVNSNCTSYREETAYYTMQLVKDFW